MMFRFVAVVALAAVALGAPHKKFHPAGGRIVGGQDANIQDYPYQVSLLNIGSHTCGGSIISEKYVVTAAHCTVGNQAKYLSVRIGSSILEEGGQVLQVKNINQNPDFDITVLDYDISILELESNIELGDSAQPIELADANSTVAEGANATISGWGTVHEGDSSLPSQLQVAFVPIIKREDCNADYATEKLKITDRMICAGIVKTGGVDSCQGDSGGPLVVDGKLTGIVSWGTGCARPGYPGVYSNVASLRDYVKKITGI